ncbi:hypothetical protein ACFY3G_32800 [Streptomyces phaeochromogenes]|uniref:hypothetical protein n=1 Tax=Streptomyces phaeochromogenes TaxID=1923 RepID=UPI0036D1DD8E
MTSFRNATHELSAADQNARWCWALKQGSVNRYSCRNNFAGQGGLDEDGKATIVTLAGVGSLVSGLVALLAGVVVHRTIKRVTWPHNLGETCVACLIGVAKPKADQACGLSLITRESYFLRMFPPSSAG